MANEDLLKDVSKPDPDNKDYFLVTITDLDFSKTYPLQFRWVYKNDKKIEEQEWSVVRNLATPSETPPKAPRLQAGDVIGGEGLIAINWDGKDYLGADLENFDRVDIHIQDAAGNASTTFGDGTKPTAFFKEAGTKTITCPAGTYTVFLKAVSPLKTKSTASASHTVTVSAATAIEEPTLPSGLSVVTTSFGLTLSWAGTYALGDTFTGFKSIDVFATTTDLGASTTTGISSSNLVANLTINDTVNKINIGLEVLKQATSTNSTTVYTTGVYIYYIAKNLNDSVYKVSGVPTYTRVNSVAVTPSKANKIDLENGLISIENLEAGNGQFTSWLRAGTGGGARIELNGGASFTNTGYSVLPGFTVYSTGGTPIFRASLDGVVSFGGYAPSDIANIQSTANGKNKVFRADEPPTAIGAGDIWIDTNDKNKIYVASAAGSSSWVESRDQDITSVVNKTVNFNSGGNIVGPIQIPVGAGSIFSGKSLFTSNDSGWFLGYNGTTPALAIGSGTAYMRWDGAALTIKGDIDASNITGSTITGSTLNTASSGRRIAVTRSTINFYDDNVGNNNASISANAHAFYIIAPGLGSGLDANVNVYGANAGAILSNLISLYAGPVGGTTNGIIIAPGGVRRNGNVDGGGTDREIRGIFATSSSTDVSGTPATGYFFGDIRLNYTV